LFGFFKTLTNFRNDVKAEENRVPYEALVLFNENYIFPSVRIAKYQFVEFMSSVGGILGLMIGCSLLSLIEFGYFIVIRPISDRFTAKTNQNRVVPLNHEQSVVIPSKLKSFVVEFLNNSSIHASIYIAKRNWFEK
jgi:hypothetical protein